MIHRGNGCTSNCRKRWLLDQCVCALIVLKQDWCYVFRTSLYNPAEADFIVTLCCHLSVYFGPKKMLSNIGIITPYQRQRRVLTDQLAERFALSLRLSCSRTHASS